MATEKKAAELSVFRHWVSLIGLVIAVGSAFAFLLLFALDAASRHPSPYVGIFAYLVVPLFLMLGLGLVGLGLLLERRRVARGADAQPPSVLVIDFSKRAVRRNLVLATAASVVSLMVIALVSYHGYHFTESAPFCGQVCHTVMQPEYTAYLRSPHARISCAECHIGSGAAWFVKAKISGLYQVYATAFNVYERPIPTPVKNLRPAQETCEQCHWPQKFAGNLDRTFAHYLSDSNNTPFATRLLLKVGGGDPTRGPAGGIHWHISGNSAIEYIARDDLRQDIPWVRVTTREGAVTEYQTAGFQRDAKKDVIRRMDCIDCHNRPSHIFQNPNDAVDRALSVGKLDPAMPGIKKAAVQALTQTYATEAEAQAKIAAALRAAFGGDPRCGPAIEAVLEIYRGNFFPRMKTSWKTHPNNLGHKDWPGCFRCHDGEHKTADGKASIRGSDCGACHTLVAQGRGADLDSLNGAGLKFDHPGGDVEGAKCSDCHNGALQ